MEEGLKTNSVSSLIEEFHCKVEKDTEITSKEVKKKYISLFFLKDELNQGSLLFRNSMKLAR